MGKRRGNEVAASGNGTTDILDGGAVSHDDHVALGANAGNDFLEGAAVRTGPVGGVDGHDVATSVHTSHGMAQGRGDVHALVTLLPQTNDRHFDAALDSGDIGESLAPDGSSATQLARASHLGHGLRMA